MVLITGATGEEILHESANSFLQSISCWLLQLSRKSRETSSNISDLFKPFHEHSSGHLAEVLNAQWQDEKFTAEIKGRKPSLFRVICKLYRTRIFLYGILFFIQEIIISICQPIFLSGLITFFANSYERNVNELYLYGIGVILLCFIKVIMMHSLSWACFHLGLKIRVAVSGLLKRKSLKLSKKQLVKIKFGEIVNLSTSTVSKLDYSIRYLHYFWIGPLQLIIITYLTYLKVGYAALCIVIIIIISMAYQSNSYTVISTTRGLITDANNSRIRIISEFIHGIQLIKMYAWQIPFGLKVMHTREEELTALQNMLQNRFILKSVLSYLDKILIFLILLVYSILSGISTAEKVFVVTAYINIIVSTMSVNFSNAIFRFGETTAILSRVTDFLSLDEIKVTLKTTKHKTKTEEMIIIGILDAFNLPEDDEVFYNENENKNCAKLEWPNTCEEIVIIENVCAQWDNNDVEQKTLCNINIKINPEMKIGIEGPVGCGKTSLLYAIIGELSHSGRIDCHGNLSYSSQTPWIITGTLQHNITFHSRMDKERYQKVFIACALDKDFNIDCEYVINAKVLTDEQKARIHLARAIYRQASVYLLDEPFSSLDSETGLSVFNKCIWGILQKEVVIVITHKKYALNSLDEIYYMEKGQIIRKKCMYDGQFQMRQNKISAASSRLSSLSFPLIPDHDDESNNKQKVEESSGQISIPWKVYQAYFTSSLEKWSIKLVFLLFLLNQFIISATECFKKNWTDRLKTMTSEYINFTVENKVPDNLWESMNNAFFGETDSIFINVTNDNNDITYNIIFNYKNIQDIIKYALLIVGIIITEKACCWVFVVFIISTSEALHTKMFKSVMEAKMTFFRTNEPGQILNRFASDISNIDNQLANDLFDFINTGLQVIGTILVITTANYWLIIPSVGIFVILCVIRRFYVDKSRNYNRSETNSRSRLASLIDENLHGLDTIHCFGMEGTIIHEFDNYQDKHTSLCYMSRINRIKFEFGVDMLCIIYLIAITLVFWYKHDGQDDSSVGLAMQQGMSLIGIIQRGIRKNAHFENDMTSVQRVIEYCDLELEGDFDLDNDIQSTNWPENGCVKFENVSVMNTLDDQKMSLSEINLYVPGANKIGICGKTGSGKPLLIEALFRLSPFEGTISIDNLDITKIALNNLRRNITIIPQMPVLFSGSIRFNLDPKNEYGHHDIMTAIEQANILDLVNSLSNGIDCNVSEEGRNFSVGEAQLICLARAILRKNKILILEEITANVDTKTQELIKNTLTNISQNCTVISVACNLNMIMDYNNIFFMENGKIEDLGSPFKSLCASKALHEMAYKNGNITELYRQAHDARLERIIQSEKQNKTFELSI